MMDQHPQCSKGWGARCPRAKSRKCTCACGGANHGNPLARAGALAADKPEPARDYSWDSERKVKPDWRAPLEDTRVIVLHRHPQYGAQVYLRTRMEDQPGVAFTQRYTRHSNGFEWGYGGSGPADLALNILALLVPIEEANLMHQDFKWSVIATAPDEGKVIRLDDVARWVNSWYDSHAKELAERFAPVPA